MTILLALLLVMDLPLVETNVTVSGKQGKSGPLSLLTGRRRQARMHRQTRRGHPKWTLPRPRVALGSWKHRHRGAREGQESSLRTWTRNGRACHLGAPPPRAGRSGWNPGFLPSTLLSPQCTLRLPSWEMSGWEPSLAWSSWDLPGLSPRTGTAVRG